MGVVYRARQRSLNRIVALKVLAAGAVQSERAVRRFQHEAQAAARLHHTNIVPVYAQGEADGAFYYAMELIDGRPLSRALRENNLESAVGGASGRNTGRSGPPTIDLPSISRSVSGIARRPRAAPNRYKRIARLFAEAAEGLAHAHGLGIVHRDIKPQNLLLGADDHLHITDFGLARLMDEPGMTMTSEIIGTPAYMSPEQIAAGRGDVDARTDIYSLGVTLYEALTGRRPFDGVTYERVIAQVLHQEPIPPRKIEPSVPLDLETICLRAMEKDPARRFPSAAAMAEDLRRYATDFPITSRRITPLDRSWRWIRRNRAVSAAICTAVLLLILVPVLRSVANANGNQHVQRAWEMLLEDYSKPDAAQTELAASGWFGDADRKLIVRALANIIRNPAESRRELEAYLARRPDEAEARLLLAWAYTRGAVGPEGYVRSLAHIRQVDRTLDPSRDHHAQLTPAAWFFRGLALVSHDPIEARESFVTAEKAALPRNFTQSTLHRARAMNWMMYYLRDAAYFDEASIPLQSLISLGFYEDFPYYLLTLACIQAAEIHADAAAAMTDSAAAADARRESADYFQKALSYATRAIEVHRSSERAWAWRALAYAHEARGEPDLAARAWESIDPKILARERPVARERASYLMRLRFRQNDLPAAEELARLRIELSPDQPDWRLYLALFQKLQGRHEEAQRQLAAFQLTPGSLEDHLLLFSGCRLLGVEPPAAVCTPPAQIEQVKLPAAWSEDWPDVLTAYVYGSATWEQLLAAAERAPSSQNGETTAFALSIRQSQLSAAAWFFRAAREYAAGDVAAAADSMRRAAAIRDNENYRFRAGIWSEKISRELSGTRLPAR
jgi:serine/threonine protein kinase